MVIIKPIEFIVDENTGCHICTSHCRIKGYPVIVRNQKRFYMSRYLWEQRNGPIPKGMCILHKCDNPPCINIEHLFLGTQLDNIKDCNEKGRATGGSTRGEENNKSKLTEKQVLEIRQDTASYKQIGNRYGISKTQVGNIKKRKQWHWLEA